MPHVDDASRDHRPELAQVGHDEGIKVLTSNSHCRLLFASRADKAGLNACHSNAIIFAERIKIDATYQPEEKIDRGLGKFKGNF